MWTSWAKTLVVMRWDSPPPGQPLHERPNLGTQICPKCCNKYVTFWSIIGAHFQLFFKWFWGPFWDYFLVKLGFNLRSFFGWVSGALWTVSWRHSQDLLDLSLRAWMLPWHNPTAVLAHFQKRSYLWWEVSWTNFGWHLGSFCAVLDSKRGQQIKRQFVQNLVRI